MLHVWLRGAAVRTAADTFSPAAMSDPLEEAVRTGRHTAMLNLSKPCESLLKYEGGIMGHHHVGLCVCVCTHGIRTENDKRKCLHSIYIFSCLANNEAECPGVASTLLPWWIAKDQFWALSEPWGLIFRSKV